MTLRRSLPLWIMLLPLLAIWSACERSDSRAALAAAGVNVKMGPAATRVGTIRDGQINEASGVAASRRFDGVFWTHNDGNDGVLYAIRRDGSVIGSVKVAAKVRDWEDVAADGEGNLYVADTGNNADNRKHVMIYRVREPDPTTLGRRGPQLAPQQSWKVEFPGDPFDIESLFVWRDQGFLICKVPDRGPADVYSFDLKAGEKTVMKKVTTLPIDQPVTGADISPDGGYLAALTRGDLWVFKVDGDVARAGAAGAEVTRIAIPPVQNEGCTFSAGGGEIVVVSETREIFAAPFPATATTAPATQPAGQ